MLKIKQWLINYLMEETEICILDILKIILLGCVVSVLIGCTIAITI
jgi:hypothetical protein